MEKRAGNLKDHYIVCGAGRVGIHIVNELYAIKLPFVIIDTSKDNIEKLSEIYGDQIFIGANSTDDEILLKAGIKKAKGLFAVTGDDNLNLVTCLTAKQLNPEVKVVVQCNEVKNMEKIKKVGADSVVSPNFIGGLRMASEMIRPAVVSFLDIMLRDKDKNLRIEEISVPDVFIGESIASLKLKKHPYLLLLAIKIKDNVIYNPSEDFIIKPESTLIFMATPEEKQKLNKIFYPRGHFEPANEERRDL